QMAQIKVPFTGGCACGAIRYECTGEPVMMFKCHCRDCQKLTSGGFAPAVIVPAQAFRLTHGQLRYHFTPSIAREKHKRGFCPECGSLVPAANLKSSQSPSEFWPAPWMIRAGFSRRWTFLFQTRNRGIKWTPRFRNSNNIRQRQQRINGNRDAAHALHCDSSNCGAGNHSCCCPRARVA